MPSKYFALLVKPRNLRVITLCLTLCTITIALVHLYNGVLVTQDPSISPYPTSLPTSDDIDNYVADNLENLDSVESRRSSAGRSLVLDTNDRNQFGSKNANVHSSRIRHQNLDINNLQLNGPRLSGSRVNERNELDSTSDGTNGTANYNSATPQVAVRKARIRNANATKCDNYPQFEPEIDAVKLYPTLTFEATWIRFREYWNTFFEARYQDSKKSTEIPYLKVFVIPHSHNDPGWLKTFDDYFFQQTKHILDNSVDKLMEHKLMTFQWSEMSFLSKWWDYAHSVRKQNLLRLIDEGRFEIVTGGWVMTDEATVHVYSMIDQLIEGHQWAKNHLNAIPKSSWSVDPFGHGSTMPYLLKTAGIKSMVIQRIHYAWKKWLAEQQFGDFLWVQRWDSSPTAKSSIFCHNAPFDIYSIKHSCGPHPHICLNFDFRNISGEFSENHMYFQPITPLNLKEKAELLLEQYGKTGSLFPHNVAMISLGDDFRYDHAVEWDQQYLNYLQLFDFINSNFKTYRTEIKFATISEYFQAVGERVDLLPTFAGDFFVYSDIFSEGRPAYWSGYYGTRPYWKKFYRETENAVRSAEILFSFANVLASQKNQRINSQVLIQEYANLIQARRHLALFAHHDATTGTSKAETMNDYGYKLMDAMQKSLDIQMIAANSILFSQTNNTHLSTDFEQLSFGDLPQKIPLKLNKNNERKIILFNNLGWARNHMVKVIVTIPNIRVVGPTGKDVSAQVNFENKAASDEIYAAVANLQLNPVMDVTNDRSSRISTQLFELTFIAELSPLSLSIFTMKQTTLDNENCAVRAAVYCANCSDPSSLFRINKIQAGNIQLTSDRLQLLFDRNSGLLLSITKVKDMISIRAGLSFGAYDSVSHRSGAYLLLIDPLDEVKAVPYPFNDPRIFIISGPIASEVNVFHAPLVVTTRLMHKGGVELEEAIHIQNQVDVGQQSGEVFMRFNTDLDSRTIVGTKYDPGRKDFVNLARVETFYTDENGYGIEKRIKVPSIELEGNYYPVTTLAFIQDEVRGLRFSVLVDRSHGFASFELGRLETLVERRTVYDDGRGMGEGVTDNRETISNYILTLETIKPTKMSRNTNAKNTKSNYVVPSLTVHHLSQQLNYPPSLFVMNYENFPRKTSSTTLFTMLSAELPCDVHLINFRTLTESIQYNADLNMPSKQALMIFQKLGYLCPYNKNDANSSSSSSNLVQALQGVGVSCASSSDQSLLHEGTTFNRIQIQEILQSDLTGTVARETPHVSRISNNNTQAQPGMTSLDELEADAFEIKSFILKFS